MNLRKHNWIGWALGTVCVLALIAIFWMLVAQNIELQHRTERAENAVKELVIQNRGPMGPEGDQGPPGRPPTAQEIARAVAAYCAAHNGCQGPPGAKGADGKDGKSVTGPRGSVGASITRVECLGTSIRFWAGSTPVGTVKMVCLG